LNAYEYSTLSDQELVGLFQQAIGANDQRTRHAVFTALVERYQQRIYYGARKMVAGDHDLADEIAQDTFVKAYEALGGFRGESQLHTWLYRIMMNGVIQRSRKNKGRQTVGLEEVAEVLEEGTDPSERLERSETKRLIEKAIEILPPKQQRVFIMRFYEEMPYEEIAQIVGTSVGGLKANYFHAVRKIGEYLQDSGKIYLMENDIPNSSNEAFDS